VGVEKGYKILMLKKLLVLIALGTANQSWAQTVRLPELLERMDSDPAVQAAYSDYQAAVATRALRETETGPRLFASASTGHYRELNSANQLDDYYGRNATIGISYPLLGSLKRQMDALKDAQLDVERSKLQIALRRAEQRIALRTTYADWWRSQQELRVCSDIEKSAGRALRQVQERHSAGWVRNSDAAAMRTRWQGLLDRCDAAQAQQADYRNLLELLTQTRLPDQAQAKATEMHINAAPLSVWEQQIEGHPAIQERRAELALADQRKAQPWYASIESSISVGLATEARSGVSRNGGNVVAAINFSMPFDVAGNAGAARAARLERWRAARDKLQAERRRLILEVAGLLQSQRQSYRNVVTLLQNEKTARLRWNEQRARQDMEQEDGIKRAQDAQLQYYQTRFDAIAAWHDYWRTQAALLLFTDDAPDPGQLLGTQRMAWPDTPASSTRTRTAPGQAKQAASASTRASWASGAYVWHSKLLLNPDTRNAELERLRLAGFTRVYLGLTASQLQEHDTTKQAIRSLIHQAQSKNIQVALLLGDPAWLAPGQRHELTDIIALLSDLPFASLHLDLEVEQTGWPVPARRLQQWLDTLAAAKSASPWPLEISSHYRWFTQPYTSALCIPCKLPRTGVHTVSLMIYTRNKERSAALARDIAQQWPTIHFRLAQSIEPVLTDQESWASASDRDIGQAMVYWHDSLENAGIQGIDWQSWQDYKAHADTKGSRK
jgi:outer membrane protein TolC